MSATKIEYYQLAVIQIETAIDLFNEQNFICAITLAGAGELILGKLLPLSVETAMDEILTKVSEIVPNIPRDTIRDDYMNVIRNGFKHVNENICEQDIDIRLQAIQYITRACTNYAKLRNTMTTKMISFGNAQPSSSFEDSTAAVKV